MCCYDLDVSRNLFYDNLQSLVLVGGLLGIGLLIPLSLVERIIVVSYILVCSRSPIHDELIRAHLSNLSGFGTSYSILNGL